MKIGAVIDRPYSRRVFPQPARGGVAAADGVVRSYEPAIIRIMTLEEIKQSLHEKAANLFGKARADELRPDLEQTAIDLGKINEHTMRVEDEP